MDLGTFLSNAYDELNYSASPSAAVIARIKRWANEGYHRALRTPSLAGLRDIDLDFDTESGVPTYGVQALDRIDTMVNVDTGVPMERKTKAWLRALDPMDTTAGSPTNWIDVGYQPVRRQPASTGLWIVSSQGADAGTVKIRGVRANGDLQAEASANLNGLTRVAIGTFTDFVAVLQFEVGTAQTGTVSLYDAAAAGHELARIPIGQTAVQYIQFRLWPTPAGAETIRVGGQMILTDLVNDRSLFRIKPLFVEALLTYVRGCEARKKKQMNAALAEFAEFDSMIGELAADVEYSGNWRGDRTPDAGRPSQLGPNFPAETGEWP